MIRQFGTACTLLCLSMAPVLAQDVLSETTPDELIRQLTPHGARDLGGAMGGGARQPQSGVQFQGSNNSQTYQAPAANQAYQQPATQTYQSQQSGSYQQPAAQGYEAKPQTYDQPAATQTYQAPANQASTYQAPAAGYAAVNSYGDKIQATVNLAVTFRLGSASLTPEAQKLLDTVGEALQSPELGNYRFLIGGHTDAVGGREANLTLSERRAKTTKAYLTQFYKIDPDRLVVRAFGEDYLLFPDYPTDGRNRRVEISTLQ